MALRHMAVEDRTERTNNKTERPATLLQEQQSWALLLLLLPLGPPPAPVLSGPHLRLSEHPHAVQLFLMRGAAVKGARRTDGKEGGGRRWKEVEKKRRREKGEGGRRKRRWIRQLNFKEGLRT
eukprot:764525-Hanusia_phi.AAC.1